MSTQETSTNKNYLKNKGFIEVGTCGFLFDLCSLGLLLLVCVVHGDSGKGVTAAIDDCQVTALLDPRMWKQSIWVSKGPRRKQGERQRGMEKKSKNKKLSGRKTKIRNIKKQKGHSDFSSVFLFPFKNRKHRQTEEFCLLDRHHVLWVTIIHYLHKQ